MIWIVASDSNHCRIYSYQRNPLQLKLVKEIAHEEFRLKKSEFLTSDKSGNYQPKNAMGSAYSPRTDPKEIEFIKFSRDIAHKLDQGRNNQLYKNIILIAPPHMNGLILHQLDKNVEKLITHNLKKDYVHKTDQELLKYLQENIFNFGTSL